MNADLVVVNAKLLTVDAAFSIAEAAAIRDGLFVEVGSDAAVRPWIGSKTVVLDARGKSAVPGLIDSHVHATEVAVLPFEPFSSVEEIVTWVRSKAASTPEGEWIRIPRAYPTRLKERRLPTPQELDAVPHPVALDGAYVHVFNGRGQRAAGVPGFFRGVLPKHLRPAQPPESEILRGLEAVHRRYNEVGITSVCERALTAEALPLYQKLKDRLTVRATVAVGLPADDVEGFVRGLAFRFGEGDDRLRVGPLKFVADGGILLGTSYMREPYGPQAARLYSLDDPGFRGTLFLSVEKMAERIRIGHGLGWQMCAHVTGDAGTEAVLDALEAASVKGRRFTLLHAYFPRPDLVRRAAALGVCLDTQTAWLYKDGEALRDALGEERVRSFIGLQEWRRGVKVALSTDHMCGMDPNRAANPFNPFLTMGTAVTRRTEGGSVIGAEQRVSREDALRMMTLDAAYLTFDEAKKGSIERGKLGDLAVLSEDFAACAPEAIRDIRVEATVVGGRIVHEQER
jgi:predicted amidohydrolase YtcJ